MKAKHILIFFILFSSNHSFGQKTKNQHNDATRIVVIEEEQKLLEEKINQLKIESGRIERTTNENIASYKEETKDLINLYVFFISIGIVFIGFLINFFGKDAIKKRIEEIISETAQKHIEIKIVETLNSKITNELIAETIKKKSEEEVDKIIKNIESKGNMAIDQLKSKGDEAIRSMLASPPKFQIKLNKKNPSDAEITQQNNVLRSDEFFNLAFNSKDPRIQIELYKNVLEIDPNNFHALNNMAVAFNNLNETANAIEALNKAIKINPGYYQAYANRAQAYNLQNNFELALPDIEKAYEINPTLEYAYSINGNILTKQGKFPEAEKILNKAVEMNPNSAEAFFNLAFFYEERIEYSKSLENYEKAASLGFVNKAMLYNNKAVLYRRLKKFDQAIDFIEKARQFNPNFPNIDGTLALIYADKKDDDNFYKYLKIALEKGCHVWNYLTDPGFDKYRDSKRLQMLIEPYRKKYFA